MRSWKVLSWVKQQEGPSWSLTNPYEDHMTDENYDTCCVHKFAEMMAKRMALSRAKGRRGWDDPEQCSPDYLRGLLYEHLEKGDPVDVANICMMLRHHDEPTYPDPRAAHIRQLELACRIERRAKEAAEDRAYTLAVAIMGGEDAPGYADSIDAKTLADQLRKERADQDAWSEVQAPRWRIVAFPCASVDRHHSWGAYCPERRGIGSHYADSEEAAMEKVAAALADEEMKRDHSRTPSP